MCPLILCRVAVLPRYAQNMLVLCYDYLLKNSRSLAILWQCVITVPSVAFCV